MVRATRHLVVLACQTLILWPVGVGASSLNEAFRAQVVTFDNGARAYLKPRPGSGSVALVAATQVGLCDERPEQRGAARFVEWAIFHGPSSRSPDDREAQVLARDGTIWSATDRDTTWVGLELPPEELEFGLTWLAQALFDSADDPIRISAAGESILSRPRRAGQDELTWRVRRAAFGDSCVTETPRTYGEVLFNIRRKLHLEEVLRFYKDYYVPHNVVLSVVGDFDSEATQKMLRETFGAVPRAPIPPRQQRTTAAPASGPIRVASHRGFGYSDVWCGYAVPGCSPHDFLRLEWLVWLVGTRVAERVAGAQGGQGLARNISCYPKRLPRDPRNTPELFFLMAETGDTHISAVERVIQEEFQSVRSAPLSRPKVEFLRHHASATWKGIAEDNTKLAYELAADGTRGAGGLDVDALLSSITSPVLHETARRHFKPERFFAACYRPYKTPRELGATAALALASLTGIVAVRRRRNAALLPASDHAEQAIVSRMTPRFLAASLPKGFVAALVGVSITWLPLQLGDVVFGRTMFTLHFALFAVYVGVVLPGLGALALSGLFRRVMVSADGILLVTAGLHRLLRPESLSSVESGSVSMVKYAVSPRTHILGGNTGRWVVVRTKSGHEVALAVSDPDQFLRSVKMYLR